MALTRRRFIRNSAITAIGLGLGGPLLGRSALAGTRSGGARRGTAADKIVVTVNLFGGNDGLNTVIPLDQYGRYRDLRPKIGIEQNDVLALAGAPSVGLNPGLTGIRDLYARGKVAILTGVGVPQEAVGLFDHEASQYEFQSADVTDRNYTGGPTGWVGRYLDSVGEGLVTPGIDFGGGRLVLTGDPRLVESGARREALSINSIEQFQIQPSADAGARAAAYAALMNVPNGDPVAERNRLLRQQAISQSAIVRERTAGYTPAVEYPSFDDNSLAFALFQCAELISADLGVRALSVGTDGYDTHSGQNDGSYHDGLLRGVGDAIAAFYADLEAHGLADRVVVLTFSEFGRRPEENNDRGTDHGYGSVGFVVGGSVRGGVYGEYPSLAPDDLVLDGNLDVTTDFRRVYATILANHLGADPGPILGADFDPMDFLG